MREIAFAMFDALTAADWPWFGRLLSENWACQKALHPSIANEQIETLFAILERVGIWGGKACGAGGGGCLLFLVEPERRSQVEGVLQNLPGEVIPFQFDFEGLVVEQTE
jgi:D-glycero-alpha-D-manno-heptose-7-phosphate kinase